MAISLAALGVNLDRLFHGQVAPSGATLYTAPGANGSTQRSQIASVVIANPSPSALPVRLGLVPQGATEDGTHYLLGDQSIPANTSLVLELGLFLRPGDALVAASASIPAPVGLGGATATSGGSLAAASYYYKISATNAAGESLPSAEVTVTTTGTTSANTLTWARSLGATGYKIYRATASQGELLLATVAGGSTVTYSDTVAGSPAGSPPSTATAGGCIFTVSGAELPA